MPPAVGRCRASWPMDSAVNRQPTSAMTTPATKAPPANTAPTAMENAAAAAGAIVVTDAKITSGRPIASLRSPAACEVAATSSTLLISTPPAPQRLLFLSDLTTLTRQALLSRASGPGGGGQLGRGGAAWPDGQVQRHPQAVRAYRHSLGDATVRGGDLRGDGQPEAGA